MSIQSDLEAIHKQCCLAMGPITDMILRRKLSRLQLEKVASDLLLCSKDVSKFIQENIK